jgi:hypothetical protein
MTEVARKAVGGRLPHLSSEATLCPKKRSLSFGKSASLSHRSQLVEIRRDH